MVVQLKLFQPGGNPKDEFSHDVTYLTSLFAELAKIKVPTDADRNQLFEKGLKLDKAGKGNQALKYYLKCLVCLREDSKFALLPQCLRNVGG